MYIAFVRFRGLFILARHIATTGFARRRCRLQQRVAEIVTLARASQVIPLFPTVDDAVTTP